MLFGQTNNPYDSRRTVGGSSGGEGAAISSCMSAFGIGQLLKLCANSQNNLFVFI